MSFSLIHSATEKVMVVAFIDVWTCWIEQHIGPWDRTLGDFAILKNSKFFILLLSP